MRVSLPVPPIKVSLPAPALMLSLPAPPTNTLSAAPAVMVSAPEPPITFSIPLKVSEPKLPGAVDASTAVPEPLSLSVIVSGLLALL